MTGGSVQGELAERVRESRAALIEVFNNQNLRRINTALAGSTVGDWAYAVAVSVFAYRQGGATAVGVFGVVRFLSMAALTPFTSTFADRYDRRRIMIIADVARAVLVALAALVIAVDGPALAVYALAMGTSAFGTAFRPAQAALLPRLATHPAQLTAANVVSSTVESLGFFVGPAIAGLLLALSDLPVVFAFNALTFIVSAVLVVGVRPPAKTSETIESASPEEDLEPVRDGLEIIEPAGRFAEASAGFRVIAQNPDLRVLVGLYAAQTVVAGASLVFSVAIALDLLEIGEGGVGLLDASVGIGGLVGGFLALLLAQRGRLALDFGFGVMLWSAPLLLIALVPNLAGVVVAMVILGLGNSLVDINAYTILQRLVPEAVMGRVFGAVESTLIAGMAVGSLAMPLLISTVGLRTGLAVIGGSVLALAAAGTARLRRIDLVALAPAGLELLRCVPFFAPLPERTLERLARASVLTTVASGEVVFLESDHGDDFFVIERGEATVSIAGGAVAALGPGDSFGEIALLRDQPRMATVTASSQLVLRSVGRRHFLAAVTGHDEARAQADGVVSRILTA